MPSLMSILAALKGGEEQNPTPVYGRDPNMIDDSGWGGQSTGDALGVSSMRQDPMQMGPGPDISQMPEYLNDPRQQMPQNIYQELENRAKFRGR